MDIIALVFIWVAFMAAKNVSKAVSAAVKPFEEIGKKIASLPKYAPLPIPGGSLHGLQQGTNRLLEMPAQASEERLRKSRLGEYTHAGEQANGANMTWIKDHMKDPKFFERDSYLSKEAM